MNKIRGGGNSAPRIVLKNHDQTTVTIIKLFWDTINTLFWDKGSKSGKFILIGEGEILDGGKSIYNNIMSILQVLHQT